MDNSHESRGAPNPSIDDLCEMLNNTQFGSDTGTYEKLQESQHYKLTQITYEFLQRTRNRYIMYLNCIDFKMCEEAGERIVLLIQDFLSGDDTTSTKLQGCKCQLIDRVIIELIAWLDSS